MLVGFTSAGDTFADFGRDTENSAYVCSVDVPNPSEYMLTGCPEETAIRVMCDEFDKIGVAYNMLDEAIREAEFAERRARCC